MNERIKELAKRHGYLRWDQDSQSYELNGDIDEMYSFAELIVEECRTVVTEVYRNTPLELCGPLLTADEKIAEHFYGVKE